MLKRIFSKDITAKYGDDDEEERYGNYRRMGRSSYGRRKEYDREYDERDFEKGKERNFFLWKKNPNVVVLCATLDINQIKSILNKINYVRR